MVVLVETLRVSRLCIRALPIHTTALLNEVAEIGRSPSLEGAEDASGNFLLYRGCRRQLYSLRLWGLEHLVKYFRASCKEDRLTLVNSLTL